MTKQTHHMSPRRVSVGAISAELLPRAPYDVAYTPDSIVAGFAFDIQTGTHAFASDRKVPFLTMPYSMALTPLGCDIRSYSAVGGEYLTVAIQPGYEHLYAEGFDDRRVHQYSNAAFKGAGRWAHALRRQLFEMPDDEAAVEGLAALLFDTALRAKQPTAKPASSLTVARMKRLHDLIEARFKEKLSVTDMAQEVGLSVGFFTRAFAAGTGTTPHAYLAERRLGEARRCLDAGAGAIADIAYHCGFSSHAHMAAMFRKTLGITPSHYSAQTAN